MKFAALGLFVACASASIAFAEDLPEMAALDVVLEGDSLEGKRVKVTGCTLNGADFDSVLCSISTKTGPVGSMRVNLDNVKKTQLKPVLENCASIMNGEECSAIIVGQISKGTSKAPSIIAEEITLANPKG